LTSQEVVLKNSFNQYQSQAFTRQKPKICGMMNIQLLLFNEFQLYYAILNVDVQAPVLIHSHVANVVEFQALEWAILDSFTGGGCNSVLY